MCQIYCQRVSSCVYWTYNKLMFSCQLKSDVGTNVTSTTYMSGAKYC
jgi:hypothetical protein